MSKQKIRLDSEPVFTYVYCLCEDQNKDVPIFPIRKFSFAMFFMFYSTLSSDEGGLTCLHQAIKAGSVQVRIMPPYWHFFKGVYTTVQYTVKHPYFNTLFSENSGFL